LRILVANELPEISKNDFILVIIIVVIIIWIRSIYQYRRPPHRPLDQELSFIFRTFSTATATTGSGGGSGNGGAGAGNTAGDCLRFAARRSSHSITICFHRRNIVSVPTGHHIVPDDTVKGESTFAFPGCLSTVSTRVYQIRKLNCRIESVSSLTELLIDKSSDEDQSRA
jgi:hypothetical protein